MFCPNLCQAKSGVILFLVDMAGWQEGGRSGVKKIKVAQNDMKHILVLKSNEIFKIL